MYLISLEMDKEIYVVGTGSEMDVDLRFFSDTDEFVSLLKDMSETPEDLTLATTIISGDPRYHQVDMLELMDVIEEETEIIAVSENNSEDPFITFIKCKGQKAADWRAAGSKVITEEKAGKFFIEPIPQSKNAFAVKTYKGGLH